MPTISDNLKDVADFLEEFIRMNPEFRRSPDGDGVYLVDESTFDAFKDDAAKFHQKITELTKKL